MIKIDKRVAIPPDGKGRKSKYPFSSMQVGDSFEVSDVKKNTLLGAAKAWASRHNKKAVFTIRHHEGTTRIWRIK